MEETLYAHEGGSIVLTDWSLDGRYLSFYTTDLAGSTLYLMPVEGDRKPFEAAKSDKEMVAARLSPDSRLLAYRSNETGRNEIWVRSVPPPGTQTNVDTWQLSTEGGYGMVWWRRDGRELYFFGPDRVVMAVQVKTGPGSFEFSRPQPMFKAPESIPPQSNPGAFGSVSRDGERIVFSVPPVPPLRQLTVFDRQGNIVSRVGAPGIYVQPTVSPDGSKVAVMRTDPQSGTSDIWSSISPRGWAQRSLPIRSRRTRRCGSTTIRSRTCPLVAPSPASIGSHGPGREPKNSCSATQPARVWCSRIFRPTASTPWSTPRELFRLKGPLPGNPPQWKHITPDGQRFVFAVPLPTNATR